MKVGSVFRRWIAKYGSGEEEVNVTQMHVLWRLMGGGGGGWMDKASWFGEPSGSFIKLNLLSFRILAQVEVMASRLCGISIKSFDFTLCPILGLSPVTQHHNHAMASVQIWALVWRNPKKTQWSATNCSRSECSFSQDMGRDPNYLYQPPYSLHVQEMRVSGQSSWGTLEVLTRNASVVACDAMCTSGNYEVTFSSLCWRCV